MIGQWQRFGQGQPPTDGEALVFIRQYDVSVLDAMLGDPGSQVVFAIYHGGMLHLPGGVQYPKHGEWWTSLPPSPLQGPEVW